MAALDCIRIYRLSQTLQAFTTPESAPTYFGGRWIAPGQTTGIIDWINQARDYLLDTAHHYIIERAFGYPPLKSQRVRAMATLSEELKELATKAADIWTQYKPLSPRESPYPIAGFESPQECALFMMNWQGFMKFSEADWAAIRENMGDKFPEVCIPGGHQDSAFAKMCQADPGYASLLAWDTFTVAPPVEIIRLILLEKAETLSQENKLLLSAWIKVYNIGIDTLTDSSPNAIHLLELIQWVYLEKVNRSEDPTAKALKALEVLRSQFGLNVFSVNDTLEAQVNRTQIGNTVCIEHSETPAFYTITGEPPSAIVNQMPGVLRIWEAKPSTNEATTSQSAEKVWIYVFNNETLGPLCRTRLDRFRTLNCPAFPNEHISTRLESSEQPAYQELFPASATFVIKAPSYVGNPEQFSEEKWKTFFQWIVHTKEHILFDPSVVGASSDQELLLLDLWTPSVCKYEDQEKTRPTLDPAYLNNHLIPEGSKEPLPFIKNILKWFEEIAGATA